MPYLEMSDAGEFPHALGRDSSKRQCGVERNEPGRRRSAIVLESAHSIIATSMRFASGLPRQLSRRRNRSSTQAVRDYGRRR